MQHLIITSPEATSVRRHWGQAQQQEHRLVVVYPVPRPIVVPLDTPKCMVGCHAIGERSLAIEHPSMSAEHAWIQWDPTRGAYRVTDAGSKHGTWVDGERVLGGHAWVDDQSVLRFGDVVAIYETRTTGPRLPVPDDDAGVPGVSWAAERLRAEVAAAAVDPFPVLLLGETGTGKEYLAKALHSCGPRRGDYLAVNCAELTRELAESQLFGHERGSFTGADRSQPGLFRSSSRGTLLLDEIGELPLEIQPKLLRVLQEKEVRPVGASRPVSVETRVVAATHRNLDELVDTGEFREDLLARLRLWEIRVPSLRDRRADIPTWIGILYRRWLQERGRGLEPLVIRPQTMEALLLGEWSDNLRGLLRAVHRLALGAGLPPSRPRRSSFRSPRPEGELCSAPSPSPPTARGRRQRRPAPSVDELRDALLRLGGSVRATAAHFDRDRRQIYRWMAAYGLERSALA